MTTRQLLAVVLLVVGGTAILLLSQRRRPDLRTRLRALDGTPAPSAQQWRRATIAGLVLLAVPAVPLVLVMTVRPLVIALLAAVALLPMTITIGVELYTGLHRPGLPIRVPLTMQWQRRLVGSLVTRTIAPLPAPPLRKRRPRVRRRPPTLTSAGGGRRLLVVPPGTAPQRAWELAEIYLGSRRRFRDVLALNKGRKSPTGEVINEDSRIGPGWALIMPRDAIGVGLVDLPGDPRLTWPVAGSAEQSEPRQAGEAEVPDATAATATARTGRSARTEARAEQETRAEQQTRAERPGGSRPVDATKASPDRGPAPPGAEEPHRDPAVLDHPPADLPWDLVHAQLLADGLLTTVALRRVQREAGRSFGEGVPPLDPAATAVYAAAALGADEEGSEALDHALRAFPAGSVPGVVAARITPGTVELSPAVPDTHPPPPFVSDASGRRWTSPRTAAARQPSGSPPEGAPFPTLVSLGRDRAGWVLIDLVAAGGTVGIDGDPGSARLVATAIALELATSRRSAGLSVAMVGFGLALDGFGPRLICVDTVDQVLDDVVRRAGAGPQGPCVLVLAGRPSAAQYDVMNRLAGAPGGMPFGALVVGGSTEDRWTLSLDTEGVLRCDQLGIVVGAQALSAVTAEAIARMMRAESGVVPVDVTAADTAPAPPGLPRVVGTVPEIVVRLFGRPRLYGAGGRLDADPLTVEIVAYLALHGIASPGELAAAVFPRGTTDAELRTALKVVVGTLGSVTSGRPGLLEYDDGSLALTGDVHADWHLFVALYDAGFDVDALDMLNAAPGDEQPGEHQGARYGWLPGVPIARTLPGYVADSAHVMVMRRLAEGRPDLAASTAGAGLRVQPFNRVLRDDLERAVRRMGPARPVDSPSRP